MKTWAAAIGAPARSRTWPSIFPVAWANRAPRPTPEATATNPSHRAPAVRTPGRDRLVDAHEMLRDDRRSVTTKPPSHLMAARRSWILMASESVAEEARTRGFAAPAFAGCAFIGGRVFGGRYYATAWYGPRQARPVSGSILTSSFPVLPSRA